MNIILAQVVGIIGFYLNINSTLKTTKNKVLLYNGLANIASTIQYLLLGAFNGAICCFIATIRNLVFAKYKNNIPIYVLITYILIVIPLNLIGYDGILSLLPTFNIIIYAIGLYQKNIGTLKIITIIISTTGMIYDICNLAIVGAISQACAMISGTMGYLKYKKEKNN